VRILFLEPREKKRKGGVMIAPRSKGGGGGGRDVKPLWAGVLITRKGGKEYSSFFERGKLFPKAGVDS